MFVYAIHHPPPNVRQPDTTSAHSSAEPVQQSTQGPVEATWVHVSSANASSARTGFSARWEGLVRPTIGGVYTFALGRAHKMYGGERLRLWFLCVLHL